LKGQKMTISDKQLEANRLNAQKSTGPKTEEGKLTVSKNAITHGFRSAQPIIDGEDPAEYNDFRNGMIVQFDPSGPMETLLVDRIVCSAWRLRRIGMIEVEVYEFLRHPTNKSAAAQSARPIRCVQESQKPAPVLKNRFGSFEKAMEAWLKTEDGILYAQNKWPTDPKCPTWIESFDKFKEPPVSPKAEFIKATQIQQHAIDALAPLPIGKAIAADFQNNGVLIRLSRYEINIERSMFKNLRHLQSLQSQTHSRRTSEPPDI
jgi:hypothetical protein